MDPSSIWDLTTKSNINERDAVQRRAARFCHGDYKRTSSVTSMMEDLLSFRHHFERRFLHVVLF